MKKMIIVAFVAIVLSISAFAQDNNVKAYFSTGNEFDNPGHGKVFGGGLGVDYKLIGNVSDTARINLKGDVVLSREVDGKNYGLNASAKVRAFPCKYFFAETGINKVRSRGLGLDATNWVLGGGLRFSDKLLVGYDRNFKDNIRSSSGLTGVTGNRVFTESYLPLSEKFRFFIGADYGYTVFNQPLRNDRARGFTFNLGIARLLR